MLHTAYATTGRVLINQCDLAVMLVLMFVPRLELFSYLLRSQNIIQTERRTVHTEQHTDGVLFLARAA